MSQATADAERAIKKLNVLSVISIDSLDEAEEAVAKSPLPFVLKTSLKSRQRNRVQNGLKPPISKGPTLESLRLQRQLEQTARKTS